MQLHEQYRPGDWSAVVGQDKAVALLRRLEVRGDLGGKAFFFRSKRQRQDDARQDYRPQDCGLVRHR